MEFGEILEITVLVAIAIELFALYTHTKFDKQIDKHIIIANENWMKANEVMKILDAYSITLDEHITKTNEHISRFENYMDRIDEHIIKLDEHIQMLLKRN